MNKLAALYSRSATDDKQAIDTQMTKLNSYCEENNIQNVNQFLIVSTFTRVFWFKLVQIINLTKNLRGLKHQHLAGAFFLASIQDNSSALFEY